MVIIKNSPDLKSLEDKLTRKWSVKVFIRAENYQTCILKRMEIKLSGQETKKVII